MASSKLIARLLITLLAGIAFYVWAQDAERAPRLVNYQGKLTDAVGENLTDGAYVLRFSLFPAATGVAAAWTEDQTVSLVQGVFNIALGSVTNLDDNAFGEAARYLETTIVSGPGGTINQTLAPRQQMLSVPYALEAQGAERAAVATVSEALIEQLAQALNPPGTIITYAGAVGTDTGGPIEPVPGYLLCNGAVIDGTTEDGKYAALAAVLGNAWGHGGNASNSQIVNLPDLRGVFLRGWNGGATDGFADPDRSARMARRAGGNIGNAVGAFQQDDLKNHSHSGSRITLGNGYNHSMTNDYSYPNTPTVVRSSAGNPGNETRSKNANVVYLIKY